MSLRAVVQLNTLRCIHENESGGAEPYVWPFMVAIHTGPAYETATTPTLAGIVESRHIIASSMKAGQAADLQFPGNNLAYQFDDGQTGCQVLLVVAMLEADDTSASAMMAGYQTYLDQLRTQLVPKLPFLVGQDEASRKVITDPIEKDVSKKVFEAVAAELSWHDKLFDDQDDFIASAFYESPKLDALLHSMDFTLRLTGTNVIRFLGRDYPITPTQYELDARLTVTWPDQDHIPIHQPGVVVERT